MRALLVFAGALLAACQQGTDAFPLVGTLERDRVEVVAEAREELVELAVSEGEAVSAGQLVARQDDRLARVEL
jgi:HlyD family secretion protein